VHNSPAPTERHPGKIFDAGCTSYVLNFGVTESHKIFRQDVQK